MIFFVFIGGLNEEHLCEISFEFGQGFLFLALVAILFGGVDPFRQL